MSAEVYQSIIDCLQQEVEGVKALNNLLLQEKEILEKNKFEQLSSVAEQKQSLSENIENSSRQRVMLMQINPDDPQQHKPALEEFLNSLPSQQAESIRQLNETLAQQLMICRERNSINGQVIATNLATRKAFIENQKSDKSPATYDAQGNVKKDSSSGNFEEI